MQHKAWAGAVKGAMVGLGMLVAVGTGPGNALAESYVAGQVGVTFPQDLQGVNILGDSPVGTSLSDLDLFNSLMYGGKVGHYFESVSWLGVEADVFSTTPNVKQQSVTDDHSDTFIMPGASLRVTTFALNILARYPGERIQPYVGVGPGLFYARANSTSPADTNFLVESTSSVLGLNALAGVRVLLTENLAAFGEYKYNRARFSFDSFPNATYNAHNLVFGVGYHFDLVK